MALLMYVDNSNVYIEAQRVSAVNKNMALNIYDAMTNRILDTSFRLDFGRLHYFLAANDPKQIKRAVLFGSRPPANDHLWSMAKEAGFDTTVIALKAREQILARNRELIATNLEKLGLFFDEFQNMFEWQAPAGGCVGFPRYIGVGNVNDFCESLVEEEGVLLLPARVYRSELMATPVDRFRIGFGRDSIDDGLQAFRRFLERHKDDLAA